MAVRKSVASFAPKAGPLAYQIAYALLSILGLAFVVLGVLEITDILREKLLGTGLLEGVCWALLFVCMGSGFAFHGIYRIISIAQSEASRKLFLNQPWYYSGDYRDFTVEQSPLRLALYYFLTIPGLISLTGLLCIHWYSSPLTGWVFKLFAGVLALVTPLATIILAMMIYNFIKHGGIELELSQMPLTPGSSFAVAAKVSQGFSPEYKAVLELKCHHTYPRGGRKYITQSTTVARVEMPLDRAKTLDGRYQLHAEMQIPVDAHPEDSSNANGQYHWEFCFSIEFDYELVMPAPVYRVTRASEIKFNRHVYTVVDAAPERITSG